MMSGGDASLKAVHDLKALGVRLEMDDFGTGYSSLSCLHSLPLDGMKIDKSFIANIEQKREVAAVVLAVVALSRNLGITLTAEGIETRTQMALLLGMECDKGQGFGISRPLWAPDAGELLRKHDEGARLARMAS